MRYIFRFGAHIIDCITGINSGILRCWHSWHFAQISPEISTPASLYPPRYCRWCWWGRRGRKSVSNSRGMKKSVQPNGVRNASSWSAPSLGYTKNTTHLITVHQLPNRKPQVTSKSVSKWLTKGGTGRGPDQRLRFPQWNFRVGGLWHLIMNSWR